MTDESQATLEFRRTAQRVGPGRLPRRSAQYAAVKEVHLDFAEDRHVVSVAYRLKPQPTTMVMAWCMVASGAAIFFGAILADRSSPYLVLVVPMVLAWPLLGALLRKQLMLGIRQAVNGPGFSRDPGA